jgi:hypothetical protein
MCLLSNNQKVDKSVQSMLSKIKIKIAKSQMAWQKSAGQWYSMIISTLAAYI